MKKVIVITGASSGMGKDAALVLIKKGHIVYALARRINLMNDLQKAGGYPLQCDITNEQEIQKAIDTIIHKERRIDVLWNNAGYGLYGAIEDVPIAEARHQFEVNLFGLATITQMVLPHMRSKASGTIINTSSMGGRIYMPLGAWYHASKHALEGWSDSLRVDVKPFGIHVVVLQPGAIATEWGGIMASNMTKHSANGAYADSANKLNTAMQKMASKQAMSPTSVITKTILQIVESNNPKTRYVVGAMAKPMMWMRKYLGDRMFDNILMSQFK
jgi:short-subunit dehydrogenase